jgi:predicted peroxiredoxin
LGSDVVSAKKKKILYVQTSGTDNPERAYAPLILATTASMMNVDATVYFVIKGVSLVKKGEAEKIKMGTFPSLKEVMDQAVKAGVKLAVCEQSCGLLGIPRGDFTKEAQLVGAATLNDLALEADAILCF